LDPRNPRNGGGWRIKPARSKQGRAAAHQRPRERERERERGEVNEELNNKRR
jgi:hypothetical protein